MDDNSGTIPTFLLRGLTNTLKQNAWAGPDHWKYQRPKGMPLALTVIFFLQLS